VEPRRIRPRKTLYYLRSLAALAGVADRGSLARFVATGGRDRRLVLRNRLVLRLGELLELLSLKETIVNVSDGLTTRDGGGAGLNPQLKMG